MDRGDAMRAVRIGLIGLAAATVLAGCAGPSVQPPGGSGPSGAPPVYVSTSCPVPAQRPGARAIGPFGGHGGGIPAGFELSWVLGCPIRIGNLPGKGQWQMQVTERADLTAATADTVLGLLRQPSDPTNPNQICTADLEVTPYYALVDPHGTAIEPAIPADSCGKPRAAVLKALDGLPFHTLSTTPQAPIEPPPTH
jgi:hypothetical protein